MLPCIELLPRGESRQSIELELRSLEIAHSKIQRRSNRILDFLRQEQEIRDARNLLMLTQVAFLFIPFSTVATILSISDAKLFAIFVVLTFPISIICVLVGIRGASVTTMRRLFGDIVQTQVSSVYRKLISRIIKRERSGTFGQADIEESRSELQGELVLNILNPLYYDNPRNFP
jgi:hypothetical protein